MVGIEPIGWTVIGIGIALTVGLVLFSPLILYFSAMLTVAGLVYGWIISSILAVITSIIGAFILRFFLKFAGRNVLIAFIGFWVL
jgi:hypothetical protein